MIASVRSVYKTFGRGSAEVRALRGVDLNVERGEVLLLTGPSGSGKTTMLSIVGCILQPSSGEVRICGTEATSLGRAQLSRLRLLHVGFVFQDFKLLPALTAAENVEIPLILSSMPARKSRLEALRALESFGLSSHSSALPAELSGGQKQRVAIARALVHKPDLLLADEPTAALDSQNGRMIFATIRESGKARNCGTVIVSHDPGAAEFADRVVHLKDGQVSSV